MDGSLQRRYVEVDGIALSYVEREAAAGTVSVPFLLLHGLIATGETFASLIAELPEDCRVVALDLPGSGFSARDPHADVSFGGMARTVAAFMRQVALREPVLLGHSHGGAVALRLAAEYPALLRAMVLLAPANPFSRNGRLLIAFYLTGLGGRVARLLPRLPAWVHEIAFRSLAGPGAKCDRAVLAIYRESGKVPGTVEHLLRLLKSWDADMKDLQRRLAAASIPLPVLLLWGDHDSVVPERSAVELEKHLVHWEHVTLPRIGHLPNEEDPRECGALIRTWLVQQRLT